MLILIKFLMLLSWDVPAMKLSKYSIIPFLLSIVPFLWMVILRYLIIIWPPEFIISSFFIIYIFIFNSLIFQISPAIPCLLWFLYDTYYFQKQLYSNSNVATIILSASTQLGRIVKRNNYVDFLLMFLFFISSLIINFTLAFYFMVSPMSLWRILLFIN